MGVCGCKEGILSHCQVTIEAEKLSMCFWSVSAEVRPRSCLLAGLRSAIHHTSGPTVGRNDFTLAVMRFVGKCLS